MFINVPTNRLSKTIKSIKANTVMTRNNRGDYDHTGELTEITNLII